MNDEKSCAICHRKTKTFFCKYHEEAKQHIEKGYKKWQNALDGITWETYLKELMKLKETGTWSNNVVKYELEKIKNGNKKTSE